METRSMRARRVNAANKLPSIGERDEVENLKPKGKVQVLETTEWSSPDDCTVLIAGDDVEMEDMKLEHEVKVLETTDSSSPGEVLAHGEDVEMEDAGNAMYDWEELQDMSDSPGGDRKPEDSVFWAPTLSPQDQNRIAQMRVESSSIRALATNIAPSQGNVVGFKVSSAEQPVPVNSNAARLKRTRLLVELHAEVDNATKDPNGSDNIEAMQLQIHNVQKAIETFEEQIAIFMSFGDDVTFLKTRLADLRNQKDDAEDLYRDEVELGPVTAEDRLACNEESAFSRGFINQEDLDFERAIQNSMEDIDDKPSNKILATYDGNDSRVLTGKIGSSDTTIPGRDSRALCQQNTAHSSDNEASPPQTSPVPRVRNLSPWELHDEQVTHSKWEPDNKLASPNNFVRSSAEWGLALFRDAKKKVKQKEKHAERDVGRQALLKRKNLGWHLSMWKNSEDNKIDTVRRAENSKTKGAEAQVTSDSVIQTTDGCVEVLKLPSQLSLSPSHRYLKPPRSPSSLKYALPSRGSIKSPSLNYGGSADRVRVREFAPFCIPLVKNSRGCAPFLPEEHIQRIDEFVNAVNNDNIHLEKASSDTIIEPYTQFLLSFSAVIKVNSMDYSIRIPPKRAATAGSLKAKPSLINTSRPSYRQQSARVKREQSTSLYVLDPRTSQYVRLAYKGDLIAFNPEGYGSYQAYRCRFGNTYKIGFFEKTRSARRLGLAHRESFGCGQLDVAMRLVSYQRCREERANLKAKMVDNKIESLDQKIDDGDFNEDHLPEENEGGFQIIEW